MISKLTHTNKSRLNAIVGLLSIAITAILNFLIIRFTIQYFMDDVNGFIRVATSIISYANLAEGSIGIAVVFLLYSPIAKKDNNSANAILTIANKWLRIFGFIYIGLLLMFASMLPFIISSNNRNGSFSFEYLFIITVLIGVGTSFSYFVSGKYKLLLTAQNNKVIITIISLVINSLVNILVLVLMSKFHDPKHLIIYMAILSTKIIISGIIITAYTKRKNPWMNLKIQDEKISKMFKKQVFGSLAHQIAALVVFSTDEITLALYSHYVGASKALILISVYSSYLMLFTFTTSVVGVVVSAFENKIGLEANDGKFDSVKFIKFEQKSIFWILFVSFAFFILSPHFINLLFNANHLPEYFSYKISLLMSIILILHNIRRPSVIVVSVFGHFKETRIRAIIEASINLVLSLILVWFLGIYGVLIATVISFLYRTIDFVVYTGRFFEKEHRSIRWVGVIISMVQIVLMCSIAFALKINVSLINLPLFTIVVVWISLIIQIIIYIGISKLTNKFLNNRTKEVS